MYVDFHSHVLPGADHGSENIEMSLSQILHAQKANVDTIVATPHFYMTTDTVDSFIKRRDDAYEQLVSQDLGGIHIVKAAEVLVETDIEKLEDLERLCIGDTNYILLEMPPEPWQYWIIESVYKISAVRRLRPILAHIDRYSHSSGRKMIGTGADIQMNANAFIDKRERRRLLELIADQSIHIIGSDAHGDGEIAYKDFSRTIKKLGGLSEMMMENARRILQ